MIDHCCVSHNEVLLLVFFLLCDDVSCLSITACCHSLFVHNPLPYPHVIIRLEVSTLSMPSCLNHAPRMQHWLIYVPPAALRPLTFNIAHMIWLHLAFKYGGPVCVGLGCEMHVMASVKWSIMPYVWGMRQLFCRHDVMFGES